MKLYYMDKSQEIVYFLIRHTINLLSLDNHPGSIFEEQAKDLLWLTEKRKSRLSKAAIKCKQLFHVGNLVTDYQLRSQSSETSQELTYIVLPK